MPARALGTVPFASGADESSVIAFVAVSRSTRCALVDDHQSTRAPPVIRSGPESHVPSA